jgi:hypothetical protein
MVWLIDRFESASGMPWLAAGFSVGFATQAFGFRFEIAVLRGRLAAVAAGDGNSFLQGKTI